MKRSSKIIITIVVVIMIILGILIYINVNKNNSVENKVSSKIQITINVFDKGNVEIYNETINTEEIYLSEVLENIEELDVIMIDGDYGKYITSILGIAEGDNYFWSYYINNEYASEGISSCKIENNAVYSFKIENYEY